MGKTFVYTVIKNMCNIDFVLFQGVGRRYAHVVLRKADIDLNKRAGELTEEEVRRVQSVYTTTQADVD